MEKQSKLDWIKIHRSKNKSKLKGEFNGLMVKEDKYFVFYIPSLQITSYGDSPEEAEHNMVNVYLPQLCEDLFSLPVSEMMKELLKLGWNKSPYFNNELSKVSYVDKDGALKELAVDQTTQVEEKLLSVA